MLVKYNGISPTHSSVCQSFEEKHNEILDNINIMIYQSNANMMNGDDGIKDIDIDIVPMKVKGNFLYFRDQLIIISFN